MSSRHRDETSQVRMSRQESVKQEQGRQILVKSKRDRGKKQICRRGLHNTQELLWQFEARARWIAEFRAAAHIAS